MLKKWLKIKLRNGSLFTCEIHAKYQSKIIEVKQEVFIEQTPLEILKHNALINGSSYEGRRESVKYILGFEQKIPIPINIEKNIYLFPTSSPNEMDCIWVSSDAITEIKPVEVGEEIKTRILFKFGKTLDLKESNYLIRTQWERAGMCKIAMAHR
ncbi:competence protein ComK [Saliterribacillus persicus]|uniref:ComK protein n=1 Tax=Saliterribacillus persicus TaxID=930114 RepID=A0A368X6E1_9BACI|nr:competence protein ComK [Saliterribacillus persicus]RCW63395.1 ComK protein [Saliterribacillus persicus]